ncbi:hypothetical protein N781_02585 [Pontibacillus halophilus JSM 076056 = DSM 19796]|uniref:HD/PDEase domain-containing protein n=1 Tax=Pontibacillus halophilus JSM 076056 = DSM 19796 TaxID=1385510 RepID=A0A0A5GIW2_9BACI|nr:HD domain-containing protein [Pontibacillus halophilus]KGX91944.1 hypothetical protein N781_02585 [Pontibacillus halophilus JSM 076056 = DSM 19796]
MEQSQVLHRVERLIYERFQRDATGHDYYHMKRVATTARELAEELGASPYLSELAGWLHDYLDPKLTKDVSGDEAYLRTFLRQVCELEDTMIDEVFQAMKDVSFSKGNIPDSLEGKIVQDADRLDALGAIGIARTFAFGGQKERPLYHPDDETNSLQHFYDKLLLLKDRLNTQPAYVRAERKHAFMVEFIEQFKEEWQ